MNDEERVLREVLTEDAAQAPAAPAVQAAVLGAAREQQVTRRWMQALGGLAATAALVLAVGQHVPGSPPPVGAPEQASNASGSAGPGSFTADLDAVSRCVEFYDADGAALARRSFAFDGTVTGIGAPVSEVPGDEAAVGYVGVTFAVDEWFEGGSAATVTVDLYGRPAVGLRLLVSGEPRWGGAPLDRAVAWPCGFTRYYDPATATDWRRAFAQRR